MTDAMEFVRQCPACGSDLTEQTHGEPSNSPFEGGGGTVSCENGHSFRVVDREMQLEGVAFVVGEQVAGQEG